MQWDLPPAPGQFGATTPQQRQDPRPPPGDPTDSDAGDRPYGFRRMEPVGVGPYNPYVPTWRNPALRDRSPGDWGNPDWVRKSMEGYPDGETPDGMHIPSERDIPQLMHGMVQGLGQWAAPQVGMPMITAGNNFSMANKNYAAGYKMQADINRQQALSAMEIADYRLQTLLRKYGNAYAAYGPDASGKDAEPEELMNRLREIATENNDTMMLRLLDRGDLAGVDRLLKHLDGQGQDLSKTKKLLDIEIEKEKLKQAQQKTQQTDQERKEWFGSSPPTTQQQQGQPATQAPGQPEVSSDEPDTGPLTRPVAPPRINEAAQALQMGEKPNLPKGDDLIKGAVDKQKYALDNYMRSIANNKTMTPDQKMAAIRAANPGIADTVENLRNGRTELTAQASDKPKNQLAETILGGMDPDWSRTAKKQRDQRQHLADQAEVAGVRSSLGIQEKLHSNMHDVLLKNAQDMEYMVRLAKVLKDHGKIGAIPAANEWLLKGEEQISGDPEVAAYQLQLRNVRSDIGKILVNSGAGAGTIAVATQHEMEKLLPSGATPEQLQAQARVLKRDYANKLTPIADEINSLNGRIAQITKTAPPPGINDAELVKDITADEVRVLNGKKYWLREGKWYDE